MNGSLVCPIWPTDDTNNEAPQYSLFFGVVVQREAEQLAKYEDRVEIDINLQMLPFILWY